MKVFIAEDSLIVSARLVAMVSDIEGVSVVGFAHTVIQAMQVIRVARPDVIIVGFHYPAGSIKELLCLIHRECPYATAIVLANHSIDFQREYKDIGATFVFDKIKELEVMVDMLTQMSKDSPSGLRVPLADPV